MEALYNLWMTSKWLTHKMFWAALVNIFFVGAFHSAVWVRNDVLGLNMVKAKPEKTDVALKDEDKNDPVALEKTAKWVKDQFAKNR